MITFIAAQEITQKRIKETHGTAYLEYFIVPATPKYPTGEGYYMWYKESVALQANASIIGKEHMLLHQGDNPRRAKPPMKVYVKTYLICLTLIIMMLTLPLISDLTSAPHYDNSHVNPPAAEMQPSDSGLSASPALLLTFPILIFASFILFHGRWSNLLGLLLNYLLDFLLLLTAVLLLPVIIITFL
jgi:hypothetical protein